MYQMTQITFVFLCFITALTALDSLKAEADKQPNFLFILVDDQRNTSLGCYGHPQIRTPNIDQLAAQGLRFENAFVNTSICMASRATIFTGLTTTGHGYAGGQGATPVLKQDIETSFPRMLKENGYRTGFFGKQHVKFQSDGMSTMFNEHKIIGRNPFLKKMKDGSLRHSGELIGDQSITFLDKQPKDQPFFLYMSFNISHAEDRDQRPGYHFQWPQAEDGMFEDIEPNRPRLDDPKYHQALPAFLRGEAMNRARYYWRWDTPEKYRINMRAYYRMLFGMDRIVGRVLSKLKEMGADDNTVVIYTADNGYYMGDRGLAGKWSHFEESLRVPLIIFDPRLTKEKRGRVIQSDAVNIDLAPTFLDLAGLQTPGKYQGVSLSPIINGETPEYWRDAFFCEHHFNHKTIPKWRGVRDQRFTYANYFEEGVELLYDREKDPDQLLNLASNPEYASELKRLRETTEAYTSKYTREQVVTWKKAYAQKKTTGKKKSKSKSSKKIK